MSQMSQLQSTLIKPNQIDSLPRLDAQTKQQYKAGLENLWKQYESSPEGSPERKLAMDKIKTASSKLMSMLAGGARPGSGSGPRPGQPQQGTPMQMQQMNQANAQQMAAAQAQAQRAQSSGGQPGMQQRPQLSQQAQTELDSVKLVKPPNMTPQGWENFRLNWQKQAFDILARRDAIVAKARQIQAHIKNAQNNGQEPSPEASRQMEEAKRAVDTVNNKWKAMKAQANPMAQQQNAAQQQANAQANQQQRPPTQQGVNAPQQPQQQQTQQDSKPVNTDQRPSVSPSQAQPSFQQQTPQNAPAQQAPQQNIQQQAQPGQPQHNQTPQTATMPHPPQNFPQQNMQQPPRPQMPNQQMSSQNQLPGQQTAMPNNVPQVNPQRPQPLSHSDAMKQASANYTAQNQHPQQQVPNGLPFNHQPQSATQQNTPTTQYPNLQTTQTSSINNRFPINKQIHLDPRTQQPVPGPPSRPTLNNQGMMFTPGVGRAPPYVLEGEGDRVLSKRKLDELVRQVTGAAPSSDNSESSSVLTPEVEESVLQVADNFVDDVITSACRLAKLRTNQTLDIRDVQMVLERNYGIRIPGYSLDEVRTVRKFQPAPGWHSKMQAVQAGKVMGSRDA